MFLNVLGTDQETKAEHDTGIHWVRDSKKDFNNT